MESEWQTLSLREAGVLLIDCDHRTPPPAEYGYPYIAIPQLKQGRLDLADVRRITYEHFLEWTRKAKPEPYDVILSRRCNPGETAFVPPGLEFALGQNLVLLRADGRKVFPPFLRWLVRSPAWWKQVETFINVGAVFDSLRCADIPKFRLPLPPLHQQEAIAEVLGSFDNKIELNRKMNATLEQIAQALFKSWFVDFDPVKAKAAGRQPEGMDTETAALFPSEFEKSELGLIPKGWRVGGVYDVADVIYGAPFSSGLFKENGRGTPLIRIRDLTTHAPQISTEEIHPKGKLIRAGDVIVGMDGEFRAYWWLGREAWLNQRVCTFVPKLPANEIYIRFLIQDPLAFFERAKVGTTVIHLGKADIDRMRAVIPSKFVLSAFSNLSKPFLKTIVEHSSENRTLSQLRDLLLPKLISGQLRVPDAERMAEAVS
jgi:type I restriction enzyme S subunit